MVATVLGVLRIIAPIPGCDVAKAGSVAAELAPSKAGATSGTFFSIHGFMLFKQSH